MTDTGNELPKLLVVDDEEAILETMALTFEDDYQVVTSSDARRALELLAEHAPVAVVITDQRMPNMTGSELLAQVYARYPETSRIILTGFADMGSTVDAINDGHVYAYVNKPWETDELKQVVRRAYELHSLTVENRRLLEELSQSNQFLEAVIDRLDTGALAIDSDGVVRAANRAARALLHMPEDPRGVLMADVMTHESLEPLAETVKRLAEEGEGGFEDAELRVGEGASRIRLTLETLEDAAGQPFGRVFLFREVSHEPLRRRFDEIVVDVGATAGPLRPRLEPALGEISLLSKDVGESGITSPGMAELAERMQRAQTAIQSWLDVDDLLASEDYPDAQLLRDRMNVALRRWPSGDVIPERVQQLAQQVEAYYESGENTKERVL
jgi:FixJ family two-component response regulator